MHQADRRAEIASLIGLLVQGLFFAVLRILFAYSHSAAVLVESWHLLAGVAIWFLIIIELYQSRLAWQQRREAEELERERVGGTGTGSVFQGFSVDEVLPMERRLAFVKRWLVPIFTLASASFLVYLACRFILSISTSFSLLPTIRQLTEAFGEVTNQWVTLGMMAGVALVCFLIARYTLGLSKTSGWGLLRAGANYLMGNAVICFALTIVLALSYFEVPAVQGIMAAVIPLVMLLLAVEMVLNLILDVYRPRVPGEEYRPIYESRILGLVCEPEGVMRSIAHTIDYQFGFKVSDTWFYLLLQRAVVPLILFGIVVPLYLLSGIVLVRPGQQALVYHFGAKPEQVLQEGLHYKWPWPIDKVEIYPVAQVQRLIIGYQGVGTWDDEANREPIVWTKKHVEGEEFQILVASREDQNGSRGQPIGEVPSTQPSGEKTLSPVNIFAGALIVFYNVKEDGLLDYVSNYQSPGDILTSVAYRQWTQYMASVDPMEIMTRGRGEAGRALRESIQNEVDRRKLGLNIKSIRFVGLHPPVEVAGAYEEAINARQERETLAWTATGDANEELPAARAEAAEDVSDALAYRYEKVTLEQARASRFDKQLQGYRVAPGVYFLRHYLDVLVSSTEKVRKFVLAVRHPENVLLIVDDKEKVPSGVLGLGEAVTEKMKEQEE